MKEGTAYAAKVRRAWTRHRADSAKATIPDLMDPIRCLATGILGVQVSETQAERAVDRLLSVMVDWNEVRVSNKFEVQAAVGNTIPDSLERCQRLIDAFQAIYRRENRISLDRLHTIGRREAHQYLEELEGMDEYAVASVLLWGLGGHAIPVNDRLWQALREAELVHPEATRSEIQAFLERHISSTDAKEFCLVMRSFGVPRRGGRQRPASQKSRKTKSSTG